MKDEKEVFDELIKYNSRLLDYKNEIWEMFDISNIDGNFIEASMNNYFVDQLMQCLSDKELVKMINEIFEENGTYSHLFETVEAYCKWVMNEYGNTFSAYDLETIIMNIHDNFDDDIFDDVFIYQTGEYTGESGAIYKTPCNIEQADRWDVDTIMNEIGVGIDDEAMSIVLEYYYDDIMKVWYEYHDEIVSLYEEWLEKFYEEWLEKEKLEELEEMEEEEEQ